MITGRIVPNFRIEEISSRGDLTVTPELVEFLQMAQALREWASSAYPQFAKQGLIISNMYRTEKHNKEVGGSSNSAHLDGRAMDITNVPQELFKDFTVAWQVICSIYGKVGGIGYYRWGIHITDYEDKFGHKTFQIRDYRR